VLTYPFKYEPIYTALQAYFRSFLSKMSKRSNMHHSNVTVDESVTQITIYMVNLGNLELSKQQEGSKYAENH
jgi:hypothetical protein